MRIYYGEKDFRFLIYSILPACFSRASAIFGLARGLRGLGAAGMKHASKPGGCYEMCEDLCLYLLSRVFKRENAIRKNFSISADGIGNNC